MKPFLLLFLSLIAITLMHCNQEDPEPEPNPPAEVFSCLDQTDACNLAQANNTFGFDIFRQLHEADPADNIFISPLSISAALSMTANGAEEATLTQMRDVLAQAEMTEQEVNDAFKFYLPTLVDIDPAVTMLPANSIWYDEPFPVHQAFLDANQEYFDAQVEALDFKDPGAVDVINGWIADNTNDRIQDMLQTIPTEAVMYLINAVYFKGDWRFAFDEEDTYDGEFTNLAGQPEATPMMNFPDGVDLPYYETEDFQILDLPFADSVYSMTLLLPRPSSTLDAMIDQLDTGNWESWIAALQTEEVRVTLPRFTMEYEKKLNDALKALGMTDAFDRDLADFDRLSPDPRPYISMVKHKSFLEVNEVGSEAAAATVVEIVVESISGYYFNADRPFLLAIRERAGNGVLFLGKVASLE